MARFSLVAIDLDGTLLNRDWEVTSRVQEAIRAVRCQGVRVTLATGRMFASAVRYARLLELDQPLVTYHGALVKSLQNGEAIYQRLLPREYARKIVRLTQELGYPTNLYFDDRLFVNKLNPATQRYVRQVRVSFEEVSDLLALLDDHDPIKVVVVNQEEALDALAEESRRLLGENVHITKSEPTYLEFMHVEATKGRGVAELAKYLNIPRKEIMAIGDSYNDLEMFAYAGLGVAMGNARDEIKAAAGYVTASNEEDGVAVVLEEFFGHEAKEAGC